MARVLVIGSGGREHALAWALSRSPRVNQIYVAPGNAGTQWETVGTGKLLAGAPSRNVDIAATDTAGLIEFAEANAVTLTVVGPEVPLANGIVDAFTAAGLTIFGPSRAAAQIEANKAFAKDFMTEQGIPTGEYFTTSDPAEAQKFLLEYQKPVVIKAAGLAAGKGVIITDSIDDARTAVDRIMTERIFGDAGDTIVIEEKLEGREISVLAFCDGQTVQPLIPARDYKRALDGNRGLNTGGMGAIAPADDIPDTMIDAIAAQVLQPVLDGMLALGTPYRGILYAGLMLTDEGFRVLEFNCRFGDPETQVILPLLQTDLYDVMQACTRGTLDEITLHWDEAYCATVVAASPGYPDHYPTGLQIHNVSDIQDAIVFHAGTAHDDEQQLVTAGGRVLAITALGQTLDAALKKSYAGIETIHFDEMHYRTDIGAIYE